MANKTKAAETHNYTFIDSMEDARKLCDPWIPMQYILDKNGVSEKLTAEEAKALFIHLTISALGVGDDSDILLCSMGLLKGYDKFLSLGDRREHYQQMVSFFKKEQKQTNKDRDPKARTKNLIQKENRLIKKIERHYLQDTPDPERLKTLLKEAKRIYLTGPSALGVAARVELPEPSYLANKPICNFPPDESLFIGREKILEKVERQFKAGKQIQILHGMGGVGKTRVARRYAYSHQYDYTRIAWIDATSSVSILKSVREFLVKVESVPEDAAEDMIRPAFLRYFEHKAHWLIVFDNADYLGKDANETDNMEEVLKSYIPVGIGHILITTRCDRDFMGAARIAVDVFTPELARQFLVEKSGLEADQDTDVLAQKLGYLPLALQYTASYIQQHCSTYREYLDLWDEDGMNLFDEEDGGYAEKTVRKAFHITLDKIKDDPIAMDLLHRLACLNTTELPVERYLEVVSQKPDAPFYDSKWFGTISSGYEKINEQLVKYRVPCWVDNERIRISPDTSSYKIDPSKFIIIRGCKQDCLHPVLERKATRNALFRKLGSYSLITWDKINISMHPLLREIIYDEMYEQERGRWCSKIETSQMLSVVFRLSGSEDAARKHLADALRGKLNQIRGNTDSTKEYIQHVQRMEAEGADVSHLVYGFVPISYCAAAPRFFSLFKDILELNDADLTREALSDYRYLMETLYGSDDILHYKIGMKACKYDKQFYSNLASAIGHDILYKSFRTPKRRQKTGEQYFIGIARHNAPHDMEYPAGEAVRVAVDVWLDDICDADELKTRLQTLVADRSGDWWVIALPEYGADVVDSLSLLP